MTVISGSGKTEIVQVIHQTVREFFLRPHDAVNGSVFRVIPNVQQAQTVIRTTCVKYLSLHCREVMNEFQHIIIDESSSNTSSYGELQQLVRYLDSRAFIRYSLELLTPPKNESDSTLGLLLQT